MKYLLILSSLLVIACQKTPEKELPTPTKHAKPSVVISVEKDTVYITPRSKFKISAEDSLTQLAIELHLNSETKKAWLRPRFYTATRQTFPEFENLLKLAVVEAFKSIPEEYAVSLLTSSFHDDYSVDWSVKIALASNKSEEYAEFRENYPNVPNNSSNAILLKLSNESQCYAPLKELFNSLGYDISITGVEKVFAQEVKLLSFKEELLKTGLKPKNTVIYDAGRYTFSVEPLPSNYE